MIQQKGKRNSALIFADKIDKQTKTQLSDILRNEAYSDSRIRIMPDTHSGKHVPVGTTMTISNRVSPSLVGSDIGCGMEVVYINKTQVDFAKLDKVIRAFVPSGSRVHSKPNTDFDFSALRCGGNIDLHRAACSMGTLGGGNHFIELDITEDGNPVLVIHSGSRQLGNDVSAYYQDKAYRIQCGLARRNAKRYYEKGDEDFYGVKKFKSKDIPKVSFQEAVLEGKDFEDYLWDIRLVTDFADKNRKTMADIICDEMGFSVTDRFSCIHNYIDTSRMILRKGAVSAGAGERVIIPLNMRDGALICKGLGNPDWNFSAPHGAGRACSRSDAKYAYTVEQFAAEMEGIYSTTVCKETVDECPMAYKSADRILGFISDTVEIEQIIKPIYNFKGVK
ncbi:MAG: RtcB family protein [Clostridia bacterium]|nr:RtcB family protein [Clostridia bacterium]